MRKFHLFSIYLCLMSVLTISSLSAELKTLSKADEEALAQNFLDVAQKPGAVLFTPPKGWQVADSHALPSSVKVMVVGKGSHEFPPSINLGTEVYPGTLKQYLKRVKKINESHGSIWKDLGKIRTEAGEGSLSQVDNKTQWGEVRMMHVMLNKNGVVYILTAAALKEEFPKFYKDFFNALRSLRFNEASEHVTAS